MNHIPLPVSFVDRVKNDDFYPDNLLESLDIPGQVSVRINPKKIDRLTGVLESVPWCSTGFYLKERPVYTLDPLFHAGAFYPQEAGSMLLDCVLQQIDLPDSACVLDLCAAPGGKSTLLANHLNGKGLLVANEVIQSRSKILRENISKWGTTNTIVTNNDPKDFQRLVHFFDLVVVDAPCSGEGMFRKDQNARTEWSEDHVQLCVSRQRRIVMDVWDTLKPGGTLIYSTCTFNAEENEENINWIQEQTGAQLIAFKLPETITQGRGDIGAYAFPGTSMTEGYFVAVLQKSTDEPKARKPVQSKKDMQAIKKTTEIESMVQLDHSSIFSWNSFIFAVPQTMEAEFLTVQATMRIVKFGVQLGEMNRKGFSPDIELALCKDLVKSTITIELSREQALSYLHGDVFLLPADRGTHLVSFEGVALGFIKHLGNRFNNLYPKEWRIRMNLPRN
jgi:NOL1/NOP2/sun family putative RNA methylase